MEGATLREGWLRARERLRCEVFEDADDISRVVAAEMTALIRARQREGERWASRAALLCLQAPEAPAAVASPTASDAPANQSCVASRLASKPCPAPAVAGRPCVLGLATGSTPMHVYRELVRLHRCATA